MGHLLVGRMGEVPDPDRAILRMRGPQGGGGNARTGAEAVGPRTGAIATSVPLQGLVHGTVSRSFLGRRNGEFRAHPAEVVTQDSAFMFSVPSLVGPTVY